MIRLATLDRTTRDGKPVLEGDTTADIKRGSLIRLRRDDDGDYRLELVAGPRRINRDDPQTLLSFVSAEQAKFLSME